MLKVKLATAIIGISSIHLLKTFIEAGTLNPDQLPKALTGRGVGHARSGAYDKALADYNMATQIDPTYAAAYYSRGLIYEKQGKIEQAKSETKPRETV